MINYILEKGCTILAIVLALTIHEYAHAKVAYTFGDPTAKNEGRVTLNPISHIDWIGMICLLLVGFGWGKPVPVNRSYFTGKHQRTKEVLVSAAGVISNFILAVIFAVIIGLFHRFAADIFSTGAGVWVGYLFDRIIWFNVVFMILNLLPVPPLDGFNIVAELSRFNETSAYYTALQYGSFILLILVFTGAIGYILTPAINIVYGLLEFVAGFVRYF